MGRRAAFVELDQPTGNRVRSSPTAPWPTHPDCPAPCGRSYQAALDVIGVPGAKAIVDVVVLVAVAGCLSAALYTASRMIYSLGRRGQPPPAVTRTTAGGVPRVAVLASTAIGFATVIANYAFTEKVVSALLATSGAVALLVYLVIAVSQLRCAGSSSATGWRCRSGCGPTRG